MQDAPLAILVEQVMRARAAGSDDPGVVRELLARAAQRNGKALRRLAQS